MKSLRHTAAALLAFTAMPLSAEVIGVEQFDYPENTTLHGQNGGTFWDYKNTAPTAHTGTKSNWDYNGFGGPAYISGGKLLTNNHGWVKREYNGASESDGAINETNVARTLFARVTVTTGATLPSYFGFASYDFADERFFLGKRTGGNTFGYEITGGASDRSTFSPPVNSTFTLVMRLDFGANFISLFMNPRLNLPMTDPLNTAPGTVVANGAYAATNWSTALRLASGDGGDPILWDDLVVATTWEELGTAIPSTYTIASDYAAITSTSTGQLVSAAGIPGSIARHGRTSFPVLWSSSARALMAAGRYQDDASPAAARAVALAHDNPLNGGTGDMPDLLTGAVKWASRKTTPATITVGCGAGIATSFWTSRGYQTKSVSTAMTAAATDLSGVDVFVFNWHSGYTASAVAKIQTFTANGGGIVCGATPWALNATAAADARAVLTPFGLTFDHTRYWDGSTPGLPADPPTHNAMVSAAAPSAYYSAYHGSKDLLLDKSGAMTLSLADKTIAATSISHVLALRTDVVLLNADMEILGSPTYYGTIAPTAAAPVVKATHPVEAAVARYQSNKFDALPLGQLFAHPCATDFPGAPLAGGTVTRTVSVNGTTAADFYMNEGHKPVRFETGVYAAPGAVITVTIPADKTGAGLQVLISPNGGEDQTWEVNTWTYFPKLWRLVPLTAASTQTGNVLGGLVTIMVPAGSSIGTFNVTVSGALAAPAFTLGTNTNAEWNSTLKHHPAPFGFIRTDKLTIYVERQQLAALSDPAAVARHWKAVMDTADEYYGYTAWRKRGEAIATARYVSAGAAYADYPIEAGWGTGGHDDFLGTVVAGGHWGNYHELGHGYQNNFDGAFGIATHGEVDVNLLPGMMFSTLHQRTPWDNSVIGFYNAAERNADRAAFLALPAAQRTWAAACSDFRPMAYDFYFNIAEAFGWQAYRTAFTRLMNYLQNPAASTDTELKNLSTSDPNFLRNRFYLLFCDATQRNLDTYFQRYGLGVAGFSHGISAGVKNQIAAKGYAVWSDFTAPSAISDPGNFSVAATSTAVLHDFSVTDVDPGETHTYSITSGDPTGAFSIHARTGELRLSGTPVGAASRTLTVRASADGLPVNGIRHTISRTFTVTVFSTFPVTTTADNGPGSLRQALADAAARPGADIVSFAAGFTGPVTLTSEIVITDTGGVTIDGSDRPGGVIIDAGAGTNRHFRIDAGATAIFHRLKLYGGGGTGGGSPANYGGSIYTSGALTLRECTFADNTSASAAGAVYNQSGSLTIERSTFYGNTSGGSGAILHESLTPMTITASTFTGNVGRFEGGAITLGGFRPATLTHCTISGNAVTQTGGGGSGGIRAGNPGNAASNLLTLSNSIVTGNTDANSPGVPNVNTGFISQGTNVTIGDARLAALGDYGGPAWTMPPMPGSPAIDTATGSPATIDQRGVGIPLNGDNTGLANPDLGAVEMPAPLTVTVRFDENDQPAGASVSLREAIRDAEAGATVLFGPAFNGESGDVIALSQSLGEIVFPRGLIVNASANPGGVTIDGGAGANRIFRLAAGSGAFLKNLTLTGGNGTSNFDSGEGGAIYNNQGTLALADCTLSGNTASLRGGAIRNVFGHLALDRCTFTGNSGPEGGALSSSTEFLTGPALTIATLTNCTVTTNTGGTSGGGIFNRTGRLSLLHCTISVNTSSGVPGGGIASTGDNLTRTTVQNSIIAGNTGTSDVAVVNGTANTFASIGGNLIGSLSGTTSFNQSRDVTGQTAATIGLALLSDFGGPTQTIALRPGSLALGNAIASAVTTDQRGFPAFGAKDSGAYEAGHGLLTNYNSWIWETLPNTVNEGDALYGTDFDGDGQTNQDEWLAQTNPANPGSVWRATATRSGGNLNILFPTVTGRTYRLEFSETLAGGSWQAFVGSEISGDGSQKSYSLPVSLSPRRFFRVIVF